MQSLGDNVGNFIVNGHYVSALEPRRLVGFGRSRLEDESSRDNGSLEAYNVFWPNFDFRPLQYSSSSPSLNALQVQILFSF